MTNYQRFPNTHGRPDALLAADHNISDLFLDVDNIPIGAYITGPLFQIKMGSTVFNVSDVGTAPHTHWTVSVDTETTDLFYPTGTPIYLEVTRAGFEALWAPTFVTVEDEIYRMPNSSPLSELSLGQFGTRLHSDLTDVNPDQHHYQFHNHSDGANGSSLVPSTLALPGVLKITGSITLPLITSNQNDYQFIGSTAPLYTTWRLSSDASRNITGIYANHSLTEGRLLVLMNVGSHDIVLKHEDSGSTASNRFNGPGAADFTLGPGAFCFALHDLAVSRWRLK